MELNSNIYGSTPLNDEDKKGLMPNTVLDRNTLNLVEAENIAKAKIYFAAHEEKFKNLEYLFSLDCVKEIHKKMFNEVWNWAGKFRTHDTNIGIAFENISVNLTNMLADTKLQVENLLNKAASDKEIDLLAVKFHYNLVAIHPFSNGNGRHARQMADLLLHALGKEEFAWNETEILKDTNARKKYIDAIKFSEAFETKGDFSKLLEIARTK